MFYHYSQNNSGGSFDFDKKAGITHHVVIEAESAEAADRKAESIGLYFDGEGDCPCCGERWSTCWPDEVEADFAPEKYSHCRDMEFAGFLHAADGTITPIAWGVQS